MAEDLIPDNREALIDFLAASRIYPMCSKTGKIFFRKAVSEDKAEELTARLNLKTAEDCEKIREEVKRRAAGLRTNQPIRNWVKEERPREMLIKLSAEKLPLSKLLAIILRTGDEGRSAEDLARQMLNQFKTLRAIDSTSISELCAIKGIGEAKAAQIKAALELGKRFSREEAQKKRKIKSAGDVVLYVSEYYAPYLRDAKQEFFNVILLDARNKVIDNIEISRGGLTASIVEPREIIREAMMKAASSIILVHNHPSGEAEPSKGDVETTKRMIEACRVVGIKVLDHVIIGKNKADYLSFSEKGLMKC